MKHLITISLAALTGSLSAIIVDVIADVISDEIAPNDSQAIIKKLDNVEKKLDDLNNMINNYWLKKFAMSVAKQVDPAYYQLAIDSIRKSEGLGKPGRDYFMYSDNGYPAAGSGMRLDANKKWLLSPTGGGLSLKDYNSIYAGKKPLPAAVNDKFLRYKVINAAKAYSKYPGFNKMSDAAKAAFIDQGYNMTWNEKTYPKTFAALKGNDPLHDVPREMLNTKAFLSHKGLANRILRNIKAINPDFEIPQELLNLQYPAGKSQDEIYKINRSVYDNFVKKNPKYGIKKVLNNANTTIKQN